MPRKWRPQRKGTTRSCSRKWSKRKRSSKCWKTQRQTCWTKCARPASWNKRYVFKKKNSFSLSPKFSIILSLQRCEKSWKMTGRQPPQPKKSETRTMSSIWRPLLRYCCWSKPRIMIVARGLFVLVFFFFFFSFLFWNPLFFRSCQRDVNNTGASNVGAGRFMKATVAMH